MPHTAGYCVRGSDAVGIGTLNWNFTVISYEYWPTAETTTGDSLRSSRSCKRTTYQRLDCQSTGLSQF